LVLISFKASAASAADNNHELGMILLQIEL
jgi:hypothetical protein